MWPVVMPAVFPIHNVVAKIVAKVAALAKPSKIIKPVVVFVAIQVCSCKHYKGSCFWM